MFSKLKSYNKKEELKKKCIIEKNMKMKKHLHRKK